MNVLENIWNLIFLTLTLFSLLLTYIFYRRSRKTKQPCYFQKSINLVQNNLPKLDELELLFKGERIRNLTITKFAIWNEGTETIDSTDVASANKLKIIAQENVFILDCEVSYIRNKANNYKVTYCEKENVISIDFDYIDKEEGIIIKIYHTGVLENDLQLTGTIKGTRGFIFKNLSVKNLGLESTPKMWIYIFINIPLIIALVIFIDEGFKSTTTFFYFSCVFGLMINTMFFLMTRKQIPDGFETFVEDLNNLN